ncbi:uncharacterized protein A4U43_C08F3770 [Asparagus officinalis]|uniref:uncharacterized protein LOC109819373 n=1 Tax=Asparagus officinalis TaxID=4686 RepID=UPI00098E69B4|nr:uncharacterized protein LOC109819373 [Asparagus officinalis]XP_020240673.1 uncharacterized protein LOC109819373 [Asparagus officinalis]ONK59177.1 uncharacterized protein A4U43_C08F3770 [Asparagus officinalis]
MMESSEKTGVSSKSKHFTVVESSYSLRKTPARANSAPKPSSIPKQNNSSDVLKSQADESRNSLPRRYPSRVRVSAVQNSRSGRPKTPLIRRDEKEVVVSQESSNRKRVKRTLNEFRRIYTKLIEEEEKQPGDTSRPDLVAYNRYKEKRRGPESANKCLGAVEGVEIGDKFEFRIELFLVGLHHRLLANIDYFMKDERLVATSIVIFLNGRYSNYVRSSGGILVCRGSGKENKDQNMEDGNFALKNSISERNPVRVILGLNGRKRTYVYGGLYSVEKQWRRKDNHSCKVFLFQLRRLEGQAILDIKDIMKCTSQEFHSLVHGPSPSETCKIRTKLDVDEVTSCLAKSGREEEEEVMSQETDSRKRVKQILGEFRGIYAKLKEEEKQVGHISRTDLVAYNRFKEKRKEFQSVSGFLGAVQGVEIGDKFECRIELFLVGMHCHQANIDYVMKDERPVAISIVIFLTGKFSNFVRSSGDILLCRGSGKENKDQKMEDGNLALKNSISEKMPIRVILGFHDKKKTYVYGGLYSAEKYWSKKGNHSCKVFLFQLRRLEGQAKLEIKDVMKLINSSSDPSKCTSQEFHALVRRPSPSENCKISSQLDVVEGTRCLGKRGREGEEEESQTNGAEPDSRKRVKQTLQDFQSIYEKLAKEEEINQKKVPGIRSRLDLDAYNLYKDKNKEWSNLTRHLGAVPGVEIGDSFRFRVELTLLGLHCQLRDIDYIRKDGKLIAVSTVSLHLRPYANNLCNSDILSFCGNGMPNRDQTMIKGNLALKNSIDAKTPVRVFHGFKVKNKSYFYVYCGLYLVEKWWRRKDHNGHNVLMFRLRRLPGQAKLDFQDINKSLSLKPYSAPKLTEDFSKGKEKLPISVVNTVDDEHLLPIEYITEVIYPLNYSLTPLEGCNCVDGCSDSDTCACAVRNGGELPFNRKGAIVEAKPLIYACGPSCKCPPSCHNKPIQHGIKFPLEIFKTKTMGWGVRSQAFIPSGSFICEYVGELLEDEEAQKRMTDEYLFAIGNNYYDESLWEGLSSVPCLQKSASNEAEEDGGFTLDSSRYGNVGKFINHSCTPNLYAQNVLYDHDDKRMPHVLFFACEDIPPLQELTYHYNYIIDDVHDSDGNIRKKECYCGSIECTGRLY